MTSRFSAGDLERARQLQQQQQAASAVVAGGGWLPVVKGIMAERGLPVGGVRAPLLSASDEAVRACVAQLRALQGGFEPGVVKTLTPPPAPPHCNGGGERFLRSLHSQYGS